jgi:hypothetical protein
MVTKVVAKLINTRRWWVTLDVLLFVNMREYIRTASGREVPSPSSGAKVPVSFTRR